MLPHKAWPARRAGPHSRPIAAVTMMRRERNRQRQGCDLKPQKNFLSIAIVRTTRSRSVVDDDDAAACERISRPSDAHPCGQRQGHPDPGRGRYSCRHGLPTRMASRCRKTTSRMPRQRRPRLRRDLPWTRVRTSGRCRMADRPCRHRATGAALSDGSSRSDRACVPRSRASRRASRARPLGIRAIALDDTSLRSAPSTPSWPGSVPAIHVVRHPGKDVDARDGARA